MTSRQNAASAVFRSMLVGASAACAVLGAASTSQAQSTPQIVVVPANSNPPVPSGLKMTCTPNPNTGAMSATCPVIQYGGFTTWAYSFLDNRVSYAIVSYDAQGNVVKNVTRDGARYVYNITADPAARTVSIWGQSNAKIDVAWADLPQPAPTGPVYSWISAATQPANAVLAPNLAQKAVCRGVGQYNRLWAGYWDGAACNGSYSGNKMPATSDIQFLTLVSGAAQWNPGSSSQFNQVGPLPPNTVNAGPNYAGYQQVLCAYAGYIGWVTQNSCAQSGASVGGIGPFVLVGAVQ